MLEGSGPAGTTLRLTKDFKTETFPQRHDDGTKKPIRIDDHLETTYDVGDDGKVRWHVNPSTRPIVAKETGKANPGPPSPPETRNGSPAGAADDPVNDGAAPGGDANANNPLNYNDHPITVPADGDNETMSVKVAWASPASDYDVKLFEDTNGDGRSQDSEPVVGTSQNGATSEETVSAVAPRPAAGQEVRAAREQLRGRRAVHGRRSPTSRRSRSSPPRSRATRSPASAAARCSTPSRSQIERGQVKALDLKACAAAIQRACAANTIGLRSVSAARRGGGVRFGFRRFAGRPVQIDVFQVSQGRRVIGERLVARFKARRKAVTWNGRGRQGRRAVLRPLPDEDAQRQGHGDPPRHAAAPQRPLLAPAGLLPPRDVRPAAELQARAGRVRRHAGARRCGSPTASRPRRARR